MLYKEKYGAVLTKIELLKCPSDKEPFCEGEFEISYAYNVYLGLVRPWGEAVAAYSPWRNIMQFKYPSMDVLLLDWLNSARQCLADGTFGFSSQGARHSSGANVLFIDGHVKYLKPLNMSYSALDDCIFNVK